MSARRQNVDGALRATTILKLVLRPARLAPAPSSQQTCAEHVAGAESKSGHKYPPAMSQTLGKALLGEWLPQVFTG
jgi:hypothetical protein